MNQRQRLKKLERLSGQGSRKGAVFLMRYCADKQEEQKVQKQLIEAYVQAKNSSIATWIFVIDFSMQAEEKFLYEIIL